MNAAIRGGADLLRVGYSSTCGFPACCKLERSSRDPDEYRAFQVTESDVQ